MKPVQRTMMTLVQQIEDEIVGQGQLARALVIGLLTQGHILIEGLPGTAKTRTVKAFAKLLNTGFGRVQLTPDLLPSDIIGRELFQEVDGKAKLHFQPGPLFNNIVLADEINRAPAKVQAALLEAMAENTITVTDKTHPMPALFMVLATQNPAKQAETFELPHAQLDRFLMKIRVDYPHDAAERDILHKVRQEETAQSRVLHDLINQISKFDRPTGRERDSSNHDEIDINLIFQARRECCVVKVPQQVDEYIVALIMATRQPLRYPDSRLSEWIDIGASPRASIAMDKCARAFAWLQGRDYVTVGDVKVMAASVLGHRITLTKEAKKNHLRPLQVIHELIEHVSVN